MWVSINIFWESRSSFSYFTDIFGKIVNPLFRILCSSILNMNFWDDDDDIFLIFLKLLLLELWDSIIYWIFSVKAGYSQDKLQIFFVSNKIYPWYTQNVFFCFVLFLVFFLQLQWRIFFFSTFIYISFWLMKSWYLLTTLYCMLLPTHLCYI